MSARRSGRTCQRRLVASLGERTDAAAAYQHPDRGSVHLSSLLLSIRGCRIWESCAAALEARPATATAISSARAVMMLSQRDCRPRALPGVTCAAAAAVSARLIGAAQPGEHRDQGSARCDRAGRRPADRPGRCGGDGGEDADDTGDRQPPVPVFVHAAHDRGHGGIIKSGERRPLHEGAEHVGAVDDLGSQHAGEGGDGCEQARGSLLDGAPLVRPGWPLRTRPIAAAGWPPGRAVVEEGAVGGLNLEQAPGRLLACGDPGWVAEMLESLNTGVITISRSASDPRAAANARGSPGGTAARSPFASDEEAITGEQLNCAAQHVEQLSRRGVVVGDWRHRRRREGSPARA